MGYVTYGLGMVASFPLRKLHLRSDFAALMNLVGLSKSAPERGHKSLKNWLLKRT
jgi:hypothetical protein